MLKAEYNEIIQLSPNANATTAAFATHAILQVRHENSVNPCPVETDQYYRIQLFEVKVGFDFLVWKTGSVGED